MFDKPVEHAVEYAFHKGFEIVGGPSAVGHEPIYNKAEVIRQDNVRASAKEKEL